MLFCNAYTSLAVQGACVATSFCSNLVRHDPALIPPVEDVPKSAFLTVHTITVEFASPAVSSTSTRPDRALRASPRTR